MAIIIAILIDEKTIPNEKKYNNIEENKTKIINVAENEE